MMGYARGLNVAGGPAYVAAQGGGLLILRYNELPPVAGRPPAVTGVK
ncbi:MAG: hypothetical protein HY784_04730 [Chloroflexi bacterium]|nr:hypothetical protein [Chloroflexota bacterium]